MLAAALPISLGGWGVRELSAVAALGRCRRPDRSCAHRCDPDRRHVVAGGSEHLLFRRFGPAPRTTQIPANRVDQPIDYGAVLAWAIPILAATAVFFQLYIPVGKGELNVNLADPLAILGGALFLISAISSRHWPAWRLSWFNTHIFAITAVFVLALLHGAAIFGWTSWALTNRFVGWFILLGYAATGALIVHRGGREGLAILLRTFAAVACSIVALDLFLIVLTRFDVELPNAVLFLRMGGFAQNPNAFAFQIMLALCASIAADFRPKIAILVTTICLVGIWFAASRAVFAAMPFVIGLAIYSRAMSVRRFVVSAILAVCVVVFVAMLPPIVSIIFALPQLFKVIAVWIFSEIKFVAQIILNQTLGIPDPLPPAPLLPDFSFLEIAPPSLRYNVPGQFVSGPNTESSNVERIASLQGALKIFLDHPIFGGGLGLFVAERLRQFGRTLVIHSTPLWLLAETGIVGLFVVATLVCARPCLRVPARCPWRLHLLGDRADTCGPGHRFPGP
jgi:hypothetical protein